MKSHHIAYFALVLCHSVVANVEQPYFAQEVIDNVIDVVTGNVQASRHIIGGDEAVPHSHPHQVALYCTRVDKQVNLCGGSLIAPQWVLTAAHCTFGVVGILAFLGSHNITAEEGQRQQIPAKSFVKHNWNPKTNEHDIALLKLATPANLNQYVQTIRLPALAVRNKVLWSTPILLAGWGKSSDSSNVISPVLRITETKVVTNIYCNIRFMRNIMDTMICADGNQAKGTCTGDSGGPMVMTEADGQKTIIGIASFGSDKGCEKKYPTVFTRVDRYLEWISEHTGIRLRQK